MLVKFAFDLVCEGCVSISHSGIWVLAGIAAALLLQWFCISLVLSLARSFPMRLRRLLDRR
ncbi:hypothetical protein CYK37_02120 [Mesorhizobium loti]|nr:hypothetical protein CYK37_02120 [Mesorhizobium loti]